MKAYLDMLRRVIAEGTPHRNRTGIDTRRIWGAMFAHDMTTGFPALTTKKMAMRQVAAELLWFISGSDSIRPLQEMGCHIWDANQADWEAKQRAAGKWPQDKTPDDGYVGRAYGYQWRHWRAPYEEKLVEDYDYAGANAHEVDQLAEAIRMIREDPESRRIIVTAWNPGDLDCVALPWCHHSFQFMVDGDELSLMWMQRSSDAFLGVPFNIASYGLLLEMVAMVTGKRARKLVGAFADFHIYKDHMDQVEEQLSREPLPLPRLQLTRRTSIDGFCMADWALLDYKCHPAITAKMAV